jgi:hypothetical protein
MTTPNEILQWFEEGVARGATHMVVVCDTFDHEDYPVFVEPGQDAREVAAQYDGKNMQRLMEVYDLTGDKHVQLAEPRVFNY